MFLRVLYVDYRRSRSGFRPRQSVFHFTRIFLPLPEWLVPVPVPVLSESHTTTILYSLFHTQRRILGIPS